MFQRKREGVGGFSKPRMINIRAHFLNEAIYQVEKSAHIFAKSHAKILVIF